MYGFDFRFISSICFIWLFYALKLNINNRQNKHVFVIMIKSIEQMHFQGRQLSDFVCQPLEKATSLKGKNWVIFFLF